MALQELQAKTVTMGPLVPKASVALQGWMVLQVSVDFRAPLVLKALWEK